MTTRGGIQPATVTTLAPSLLSAFLLVACASPAASGPPLSASPSSSSGGGFETPATGEATASVTSSTSPSATGTSEVALLELDALAEVRVDSLNVRAGPALDARRLGTLSSGELAYVVAGPTEADGYTWYELASVRQRSRDCAPSVGCNRWFGWAAALTPQGDKWIVPREIDCPTTLNTSAYLSLWPAERLVCAGHDAWTIVAYLAPKEGGRGCPPDIWIPVPGWLHGCSLLFPQPEASELDDDSRLHASVSPVLKECADPRDATCPFEALKGSWIQMNAHLDDPAARTCHLELSSEFNEAPYPPPDPDLVVFACRQQLVVTEVTRSRASAS
jgi:hypothetical protein